MSAQHIENRLTGKSPITGAFQVTLTGLSAAAAAYFFARVIQ